MSNYRKAKLIRISPKLLIQKDKASCHIYKKGNDNKYEKLANEDQSVCDDMIEQLENENIDELYIRHEDFEKYSKDISNYLSSVMDDENTSALIKSELLHELASDTMHDLLTGEITKSKINMVSESVDSTVKFILNDPNAIKSMIEVTAYDYYTYTHSVDVSTYALGFGAYLGLNEIQLQALGKGAMLHDLGKKRVPSEIINKNGKLTDEEFDIIKKHPSYGVEILKEMGEENKIIFAIVEQHHEKMKGDGYPKGLSGKEIHPFSQIVALCDIFNALTTRRSYKEPMSSFEAFKIMHMHMAGDINLKLLAKFIKFMADK